MRRSALLLTAMLALVLASQTGAASAKRIVIQLGDTFTVSGTNLLCQAAVGKTTLKGQKLVGCYTTKNGKPIVGSYAPGLGADGRVAVARVKPDGSAAIVFNRKPASLRTRTKNIVAQAGDDLFLGGTDLVCQISSDSAGVYPSCFRAVGTHGRPNSFAIAETQKFVAVVQFDATGKKTKIVFQRNHGA